MTFSVPSSNSASYSLFETQLRDALLSLKLPPDVVVTTVNQVDLPTFQNPVEQYQVETKFHGATCLITFGESAVEPGLYYSAVELQRVGEPTLFLKDYLASRKDPRMHSLRFRTSEHSIEAGIGRIVQIIAELFNSELLPLLEGRKWLTAPLDWGGLKEATVDT